MQVICMNPAPSIPFCFVYLSFDSFQSKTDLFGLVNSTQWYNNKHSQKVGELAIEKRRETAWIIKYIQLSFKALSLTYSTT